MKKICIGFKIVVLLSMLTGLGCPLSAFALGGAVAAEVQGVQISGRVVDTKGEPLIGVNVVIVGTTTGVSTDINGKYVIRGVPVGNSLRFTYMGYVEKLIKVTADMKVLDVVLEEDSKALDEVIVVAYGTQKRESVLSSVSTVNAKNLIKTTASTTSTALVGKMAGVNSRHTEGTPGSSAKIQIRNLGDPLYVIDGVIKDAGEFNNLDMNDIESLSVVKDGAAAIYGVKAANGGVLVKTKRGSGKFTVGVNFYHSWQSWARFPEMGNAYEVTRAQYERKINSGVNVDVEAAKAELEKYKEGYYNPETGEDYRSFDWTSFARKNVPMMYYNVNASGGNEKFNYYVALSHIDQDAVFKDFNFNRSNFQANLEAQITETLKIGMTSNGRIETRDNPGLESDDDYMYMRWGMIANDPRYRPYANDNPKYPAFNDYFNGAMNLGAKTKDYAGYYKDVWRVFEGDWHVEWKTPLPGLTARVMYSYFYATQEREAFQKAYDLYTYDRKTDTYNVAKRYEDSWMQRGANAAEKNSYQATLNYEQTFADKHQVHVLLGVEGQKRNDRVLLVAQNPVENNFIPLLTDNRDLIAYLNDGYTEQATAGFIARVNYAYEGKYLVELSGRYDGSWKFPKDNRWGFFPSISAGWRISEEKFYKNSVLSNWMNNVKIRASYGEMGDDNVGGYGDFDYLGGYTFNQGSAIIARDPFGSIDGTFIKGSSARQTPVTTVSWLTSKMINVGIDLGFLNNRMTVEFDMFQRRRSGLLADSKLIMPREVSVRVPQENLNSDMTTGLDASIRWNDEWNDLHYSVGGTVSLARLKNVVVANERSNNSWDYYLWGKAHRWANAGGKAGTWMYQTEGRFTSQEEIDNYPVDLDGRGNRTLLPGDFKFKDINKDGKINDYDLRPLGYGMDLPYLNFGINLSVEWKGIDLAADFAGAAMQTMVYGLDARWAFWDQNRNAPSYMLNDRWHHEDIFDPTSPWVPGKYPALRTDPNENGAGPLRDGSTFLLNNTKYLRMKNLEIGYSLPQRWLEKMRIERLRVYLNGSNLFSIDNQRKRGLDPEQGANTGLNYPIHKVYTVGVNLAF